MSKALFAMPFAALTLIAAKPAPVAPPVPFNAPAAVAADPANKLVLQLSTGGTVVIQLRPDVAPHMVQRVQMLARQHFYDGLRFHRVIPGFMAQGGDPKGDGTGGSPLPDVPAEFSDLPHLRGSIAAARANDPNSANSQFYIMFSPTVSLDHKYTVFGRVVSGMDAVDKIAPGEPPENPTTIVTARLADGSSAPAPAPAIAPAPAPAPTLAPAPAPAPTPAAPPR
ncbi:peptidylprolyl isomerase [Sphingomonas ginkgonis]|uniref:Peptidyl-prolyl cis-trans isomerase n=1 Tax=Sphingomonas ginkgonis TaxID=2315330 RepID=A0A429V8G0_9SPHN|nr:peptidylprolyl isomerase [Sphingomonas ginkgonis]RST30251.1 peptidylprolyl isomerase [Sphingomonas ginkgonis]